MRSLNEGSGLRTRQMSGFVFVAVILALPCASARAQNELPAAPSPPVRFAPTGRTAIDLLAADAARAILEAMRGQPSDISSRPAETPRILVADFVEAGAKPRGLGDELAQQFLASISRAGLGLDVLDRNEYLAKFAADDLPSKSYTNLETWKCYGWDYRSSVVVLGDFDISSDKIDLRVRAVRLADSKVVFDGKADFPMTPTLESLASAPAPASSGDSTDGRLSWTRQGFSSTSDNSPADLREKRTHGYAFPTCVSCPPAGYPGAASVAKVQGTVLLSVEISADGLPTRIWLEEGLPCGLNQAAIDSVSRWKMNPAAGPDGKPVACIVQVEVNFSLY